MKANELMIGDLVMYNYDISKVKGMKENAVEIDGFDYGMSGWTDYFELTPIPLTQAILEKNGWKIDDRGYSINNIIFLNKDNFGGWAIDISEEFVLTISFVHQLQHLLFGLGINSEMEV